MTTRSGSGALPAIAISQDVTMLPALCTLRFGTALVRQTRTRYSPWCLLAMVCAALQIGCATQVVPRNGGVACFNGVPDPLMVQKELLGVGPPDAARAGYHATAWHHLDAGSYNMPGELPDTFDATDPSESILTPQPVPRPAGEPDEALPNPAPAASAQAFDDGLEPPRFDPDLDL